MKDGYERDWGLIGGVVASVVDWTSGLQLDGLGDFV